MKTVGKILVLILLLGFNGCVASSKMVPSDRMAKITKIAIIAMEPPPLILPKDVTLNDVPSGTEQVLAQASRLTYVPIQGVQTGGRTLIMVFGIVMLVDLIGDDQSAKQRYKELSKNAIPLDEVLYDPNNWVPTTFLVQEAANHIKSKTGKEVIVEEGLARMPGVLDRGRTHLMENWYAPIRAWYSSDKSNYDYSKMTHENVDIVLEVGLLNYEIGLGGGGTFYGRSLLKLLTRKMGKFWAEHEIIHLRDSVLPTFFSPRKRNNLRLCSLKNQNLWLLLFYNNSDSFIKCTSYDLINASPPAHPLICISCRPFGLS